VTERTTAELIELGRAYVMHPAAMTIQYHMGEREIINLLTERLAEMKREMESRELHHFETEKAVVESGMIECPHWTPGTITLRSGCTACEAAKEE
jgi:hypothetical protein